jgi:hypothetical protein
VAQLQEEVVGLGFVPIPAVGVRQVQAAVFWDVEAFVLEGGSDASALAGDGHDGLPFERQIGKPGKGGALAGGSRFLTQI